MRNERFVLLGTGLYASVIIFVAELRCVKYEPIVNESGGQVAFPRIAPHRAVTLVLLFLSHLRRTRVTLKARMQRATPANRNQYHAGLLRRGLLYS